jgi:hypothetical protein
MKELDFEKCAQEVSEMQDLPPASVEISRLGAIAMITVTQAAVQQQPWMADDEWAKIGIAAARQLQENLFDPNSETYKVLELGWNPDITTHSVISEMLKDIEGDRRSTNIIEQDGGRAETISQQVSRKILESQGYLDM